MLTSLRVKNLALVDKVRINFTSGLNIITGETGAGKSILIGALGLLLGERADKSMIRSGESACGAEAFFELEDSSAVDTILEELGLDSCEDGQLIIRRIIRSSGANQNLVNDSPVTLQVLKQLGDVLLDMHGPHDHQSLLQRSIQLDILDSFGHLWKGRDVFEKIYREGQKLIGQREALELDENSVAEQLDLYRYRVKEIEDADLKEEEEVSIQQDHNLLSNAQQVLELGHQVLFRLMEHDESAFNGLAFAQKQLQDLARLVPEVEPWVEEASAAAAQVQELCTSLSSMLNNIEGDHGRLEWLEERFTTYQRLKKKYGPEVSDVLECLAGSRERLKELGSREERIAELDKNLEAVTADMLKAGEALSLKRSKAATKLAQAVTEELQALGFPHGAFGVTLSPAQPGPSGLDEVDFSFAPNVGEESRSLRAIASSGEISRVMLATKTVVANHDRIPVLVFDEVDANVGGEMGQSIGLKLKDVSKHHQVICITHLPQVAIYGDTHHAVKKEVKNRRTFTHVDVLDQDLRVEEVARMLGGRDLTSVTLEHAREMIEGVGVR